MTPHALNVQGVDGEFLEIPPSGVIARVGVDNVIHHVVDGVVIHQQQVTTDPVFMVGGEIDHDYDLHEGALYIVSGMARVPLQEAYPECAWFSPGNLLRNEQGQPIGCEGLVE